MEFQSDEKSIIKCMLDRGDSPIDFDQLRTLATGAGLNKDRFQTALELLIEKGILAQNNVNMFFIPPAVYNILNQLKFFPKSEKLRND